MAAYVEIAGYAESDTMPPSRFFAADSEFHRHIAIAARNDMLLESVEDGRAAMFLPVGAIFTKLHPSANEHHDEIFDAILQGDAARAETTMVAHIEGTRGALREFAEGPVRSRFAARARRIRAPPGSGRPPSRAPARCWAPPRHRVRAPPVLLGAPRQRVMVHEEVPVPPAREGRGLQRGRCVRQFSGNGSAPGASAARPGASAGGSSRSPMPCRQPSRLAVQRLGEVREVRPAHEPVGRHEPRRRAQIPGTSLAQRAPVVLVVEQEDLVLHAAAGLQARRR